MNGVGSYRDELVQLLVLVFGPQGFELLALALGQVRGQQVRRQDVDATVKRLVEEVATLGRVLRILEPR